MVTARLLGAGSGLAFALRASAGTLPTADCPLPTADCPLPTADCPLPTADYVRSRP